MTLQTLDREVETIRPAEVQARIERCQSGETADPFTAERQKATISHLERLLEHRAAIVQERERTGAIVDYALAFLEEARAGLAVARELPGEAVPDRLATVLHRLRSQAREGDNRRRTKREIDDLDQT